MPFSSSGPDIDDFDLTDSEDEPGSHGISRTDSSRLQERFAAEMQDLAQKRGHNKVAVLLLQWEPEDESFMDTRDEVKSLRRVFEEKYKFTVREKNLHTQGTELPRHQLNFHLTEFIKKYDHENSLLIVYYAGHGIADKRHKLWLQGGNGKKGKSKRLYCIPGEDVELQLNTARSDLLVIFDCCYAGLFADNDTDASPRRIFEFLGSTLDKRTAIGPGELSFTKALIWALEQLHAVPDGFTTNELKDKIRKAPKFKDWEQEPVWSPRGKNPCSFMLKISPLEEHAKFKPLQLNHELTNAGLVSKPPEDKNQVHLQLQLTFNNMPSKRDMSLLAIHFKHLVTDHKMPLNQVRWKGLSTEDPKMDFRGAALVVLHGISHRRQGSISMSPEAQHHGMVLETACPQMLGPFASEATTTKSVGNPAQGEESNASNQANQLTLGWFEIGGFAKRLPTYQSGRFSYALAFSVACMGVACICAAQMRLL